MELIATHANWRFCGRPSCDGYEGASRGFKAAPPPVSDVVGEVAALAPDRLLINLKIVEAAARGWSANTIRTFLSDIRFWEEWCRRNQVQAGNATAEMLAGPDQETSATKVTVTRAASTIGRYPVNIGWAHRTANRDGPTAAPFVGFEHRAARRHLGTLQRQARAIRP